MWTIAALLSAQFQHLHDPLYQKTKRLLESMSLSSTSQEFMDTEQAQACIVLAIYETMRTYRPQAWMSAGRAFRLVQAMRLHEIDSADQLCLCDPAPDFIETEEKRRLFWTSYFVDHLYSILNKWPITLNEHVVRRFFVAPPTCH